MPKSALQRLNIEASIAQFLADQAVLTNYAGKGFETFEQAIDYLAEKVESLEAELVEQEEESS